MLSRKIKYSLERFVWCIAAMGFCLVEITDYPTHLYHEQMVLLIGIGSYYCLKLEAFHRKKLPFTLPAIGIGLCVMGYFIYTNYFYNYYFFNKVIPVLVTITVLLYALIIYDCFEKRTVLSLGPSYVVFFFFACWAFLSVNEDGHHFLLGALLLLPYTVIAKNKETQKNIFLGITDGICIGFWIVQVYCWKHRPYNATDFRYKGASSLCIYAGRIYMLGFAAWLSKYVQLVKKGADFLCVSLSWIVSVFILSLLYLTGNRGTVVAVVCTAVILIGFRYFEKGCTWKEKAIRGLHWLGNICGIGLLSLMLFPAAYASVRYLPAYFDEPDYLDSCHNRYLSYMTQDVGLRFLYDNEYNDLHIMQGDDKDSAKYVTYLESLTFNIGRLIPGMGDYFYEEFGDELWDIKVNRIETMYEAGLYSDEEYVWYNNELVEHFEEKYVGGSVFADVGEGDFSLPFKELIYKIISLLVLPVEAGNMYEGSEIYPGDTPEYPWSTRDELKNGLGERMAIYNYTIRHLNVEGHSNGSFAFYQTEENTQPHSHNIFLQAGYDFGISAMCIFVLLFLAMFIICLANIIKAERYEYLFPISLIICTSVFGLFDVCISAQNGLTAFIVLIAICLHEKFT